MEDIREAVKANLGALETLETIIPGFSGYKGKEIRREADKLLRVRLTEELKVLDSDIDAVYEDIVNNKLAATYEAMDAITAMMDKITSKVEIADYGYAGFFSALKIREDALDRMYEFDKALFADVAKMKDAVEALADDVAEDGGGAAKLVKKLKDAVMDFDKKFDQRKDVVLKLE